MTRPSPLYAFCRGLCRTAMSVLFDFKAYGTEHVPKEGGVLIVMNHESYLDPMAVGIRIYRPMSFMAKSELFEVPVFGRLIYGLGAFPVRQGRGDKAAIEETIARLQEGHMLTIFPEGSRSEDGQLQPIQKGVALVVRRANVPIVPAVIIGSFKAWPRGQALPNSHPVRVLYGPPLESKGLKGEQISQLIDQTFRRMLVELKQRDAHERSRSGRAW